MAEPLKNVYDEDFLRQFSNKVYAVYPDFDRQKFMVTVLDEFWEELPLKARMHKIAEALGQYLPSSYEAAIEILFEIEGECNGFPYLFFPDFVATYGLSEEYWELSMIALERFTIRSSAEFAIRNFLLYNPVRIMRQMEEWAKHSNEHVRRLASEGCRPRLPWGQALPIFKIDPTPVLRILEILKSDQSLYVRKSVANNLNDIAKDHPALVIETVSRWQGVNSATDWIVRQGCRTLIRNANPKAMALFGYEENNAEKPITVQAKLIVEPAVVSIGDICKLNYELSVREGAPLHLRVEYGIDFIKSSGRCSRKIFLLTDKIVQGGTRLIGIRKHSWMNLTTRRHYPGEHRIVLLVNGQEVANAMIKIEI